MRVSSSQSHMGLVSAIAQPSMLSSNNVMSHPQSSFAPSPAYHHHHQHQHQSPALVCATPMSIVSTGTHTPLHPPAQFQFQMQPQCSVPMPMSAMDLASVPATNSGPYMGSFVGPFGEPIASMENVGYFGDNGSGSNGDVMYGSRRPNVPSRLSWHGPESMNKYFVKIHKQQLLQVHQHNPSFHMQQPPIRQASSLGVSMGAPEHGDVGFSMIGEGHAMAMGTDGNINHSPVDWTMFAGISAPPAAADFPHHTPQLHHVSSFGSIDIHHSSNGGNNHHHHGHSHSIDQSRVASMSAMEIAASGAMVAAGCEGSNSQGMLSFYDEMLRDPSTLINVFGQELSGWQCPAKTNTIDPAALCAVDSEANTL
ncbi:hypothetical protein GGI21_004706 [Coemansia aciculifera]|nr:hypothetical protein GGI21_004706 [Coemansia aciculifera]